jgi:ribosomal protein S18 acetylase RimI-like enzyme
MRYWPNPKNPANFLAIRHQFDLPTMIRQAVPGDAEKGVPLIIQALGQLAFVLSGTSEPDETAAVLAEFFRQEDNRISYQNALVMEEDGELVGLVILYSGARARELDAPLERAAAIKSGDSNYRIPPEPEPSEYYLDTLSIDPHYQGKGYGRKLIEAACDHARALGHLGIALLADVENGAAIRLYKRAGFHADNTEWIAGEEYVHMTRRW